MRRCLAESLEYSVEEQRLYNLVNPSHVSKLDINLPLFRLCTRSRRNFSSRTLWKSWSPRRRSWIGFWRWKEQLGCSQNGTSARTLSFRTTILKSSGSIRIWSMPPGTRKRRTGAITMGTRMPTIYTGASNLNQARPLTSCTTWCTASHSLEQGSRFSC